KEITLSIWDVSGQDIFSDVRAKFYKESDAAILVFDLTRQKTFENLRKWGQELQRFSGRVNIPLIYVGNKSDLSELREVNEEEIIDFVMLNPNVPYFTTSAKTGESVDDIFRELTSLLVKNRGNKKGEHS
ncbi:MAG: Rab family GTPase, partial [Candidatus Hodarchaeota archaeon]